MIGWVGKGRRFVNSAHECNELVLWDITRFLQSVGIFQSRKPLSNFVKCHFINSHFVNFCCCLSKALLVKQNILVAKGKIFIFSAHECDELVLGCIPWFFQSVSLFQSRKMLSNFVKCHFINSHFVNFCCCLSKVPLVKWYILVENRKYLPILLMNVMN